MNHPESIEIKQFTPPLPTDLAHDLMSLLAHKGSPWLEDIQQRIEGNVTGAIDRYFIAFADGRMVGHVWYTVAESDPRLGLIGHVFTHPDFRQRGIAARLLEVSMTDFRERGGVVMQLFTSTPFSIPFYERLGFQRLLAGQVYHDMDWYMRYPTPSDQLVSEWFQPSSVTIRELVPADLPQYCLLYNCNDQHILKDRSQCVGLGLEAELAFIDVTRALARNQGICLVLENDATIVGAASIMRNGFPHQSHVAIFDFYVHSAFSEHVSQLARQCLDARGTLGVAEVYAIAVDEDKRRSFAQLGFAPRGLFADHYKVGDQLFDCELFQFE